VEIEKNNLVKLSVFESSWLWLIWEICLLLESIEQTNRSTIRLFFLAELLNKIKAVQTKDLILEIQRLPIAKRFYVVEETLKSIKNEEMHHQMELAVNELYEDYLNDKDLTSFTSLDFENFYETK